MKRNGHTVAQFNKELSSGSHVETCYLLRTNVLACTRLFFLWESNNYIPGLCENLWIIKHGEPRTIYLQRTVSFQNYLFRPCRVLSNDEQMIRTMQTGTVSLKTIFIIEQYWTSLIFFFHFVNTLIVYEFQFRADTKLHV